MTRPAYALTMTRCRHGLILLTVLVAGCGESAATPPKPRAADVSVIRAWGVYMQQGETKRASALFAIPAVVANNTPELPLRTRKEVEYFNSSLPCGGRLVGTRLSRGAIIATFELTHRPGGECGAGTGHLAAAAFTLRDGKIVRWIRVANPASQAPEGELVSVGIFSAPRTMRQATATSAIRAKPSA